MASTIRMRHPNGDVKVIPTELEKQFRERGWKQDTGTKSTSDAGSGKTSK